MTSYHAHLTHPPQTIIQYRKTEHALHQGLTRRTAQCIIKHEGTLLKSEARRKLSPHHPKLSPLLIELKPLTMSTQQSPTVTPKPATASLPGTPKAQQHAAFMQRKAAIALAADPHKDTNTLAARPPPAHPAPQDIHPTKQQNTLNDEHTGENVQGVAYR